MTQDTTERYSPEEWEHFRQRFSASILNNTEIAILGQSMGISWPFKGSDETPAKYIQYEFEELNSVPGLVGKKSRVKVLMNILRETLAFDDPFSDMVDTVESGSAVDDAFERILDKLEIPESYPVEFVHFSAETQEQLKTKGAKTLIDAIHIGQDLDRELGIAADLVVFLNGLAHVDVATISKYLPYRRVEHNLHFAEAVGLIARDLEMPVQFELLKQAGVELKPEEEEVRQAANQTMVDAEMTGAMNRFDALCHWFTKESADLGQICSNGGSVERYFIAINDAHCERIAGTLARAKFGIPVSERRGFMSKISGLFGR